LFVGFNLVLTLLISSPFIHFKIYFCTLLIFAEGKQLNIYKYSKDNSAKYSGAADDNNNASMENIKAKHWKSQEDSVQFAEDIAESGRIFVRNLSYTVTEDDLTKLFEKYGKSDGVREVLSSIPENTPFYIFII
jgi:RNA-binding proteins (RRM domain)